MRRDPLSLCPSCEYRTSYLALGSPMYMHGPQEDSKEVAALSEQNEEVEMPTLTEGSEVPRYSRDVAEM